MNQRRRNKRKRFLSTPDATAMPRANPWRGPSRRKAKGKRRNPIARVDLDGWIA